MILGIAGRGPIAGASMAGRISPDETRSDGLLVSLPAIISKDDDTLYLRGFLPVLKDYIFISPRIYNHCPMII